MRVLFKLGFMVAILGSITFNSMAFGDNLATSTSDATTSMSGSKSSGKPVYLTASLDEKNSKRCHMVEETPLCQGMAPQKSQAADHGIKTSLSSSPIKHSETSKTFLHEK